MNKITEVKLLNDYPEKVEPIANDLIAQGWQPLGPMMVAGDSYGYRYVLTMVKYGAN